MMSYYNDTIGYTEKDTSLLLWYSHPKFITCQTQWFSIQNDFVLPKDIWQCMATFLMSKLAGVMRALESSTERPGRL